MAGDQLANCIYLMNPIPHFLTRDMLAAPGRVLSVFTDISYEACEASQATMSSFIISVHPLLLACVECVLAALLSIVDIQM